MEKRPLGDTGSGRGVAWGDYDNDGDLDLAVGNFNRPNVVYENIDGELILARSEPADEFVDPVGGEYRIERGPDTRRVLGIEAMDGSLVRLASCPHRQR